MPKHRKFSPGQIRRHCTGCYIYDEREHIGRALAVCGIAGQWDINACILGCWIDEERKAKYIAEYKRTHPRGVGAAK
jgi:hypothetical protein